jgi:uncharacterized protein DUF4154
MMNSKDCHLALISRLVRASVATAVALLALVPIVSATEDFTREYKVKAGFLFNFTKFVEWPTDALASADSPLVIGVFADDPAAGVLVHALENKTASGRPITLKLLAADTPPFGCQMFFLGRAKEERLAGLVAQTRGRPILTVGEVDQFAQRGGIINLVRKDDSFRFEVNLEAAEKARLKISASLASMATIVKAQK